MKKNWWIVIAASILIIIVAGYFISNQGSKNAPNTTAQTQQQIINASALAGFNPTVTVAEYSFIPDRVIIKTGHTVTWVNAGNSPHTVTSDSGTELTSSQIQSNGGTYPHTFLKAGTYMYHCSIHPSMRGVVIVVE